MPILRTLRRRNRSAGPGRDDLGAGGAGRSEDVADQGGIEHRGIELDGTIGIGHRADVHLKNRLNAPGAFRGEIQNQEHIGKTTAELVVLWNADHPNDPVA